MVLTTKHSMHSLRTHRIFVNFVQNLVSFVVNQVPIMLT
jgi:hypothetical protein